MNIVILFMILVFYWILFLGNIRGNNFFKILLHIQMSLNHFRICKIKLLIIIDFLFFCNVMQYFLCIAYCYILNLLYLISYNCIFFLGLCYHIISNFLMSLMFFISVFNFFFCKFFLLYLEFEFSIFKFD